MLLVFLLIKLGYSLRDNAAHDTVEHLDDRDFNAELNGDGGSLQADVTRPDYDHTAPRLHVFPNRVDITNRPQVVNAAKLYAGQVEMAWVGAQRQNEIVVWKLHTCV